MISEPCLGGDDHLGELQDVLLVHAGLVFDQLVLVVVGDHDLRPRTPGEVLARHADDLPDGRVNVGHAHLLAFAGEAHYGVRLGGADHHEAALRGAPT